MNLKLLKVINEENITSKYDMAYRIDNKKSWVFKRNNRTGAFLFFYAYKEILKFLNDDYT